MEEDINLRYYYELEASESFEEVYFHFLKKVEQNEARYKNLEGSYIDPDSVSDVKKISFYNHLTCFLNHQENYLEKKEKFFFVPPSEARLTKQEKEYNQYKDKQDESIITVIQDNKIQFRLKSDQFGFSAAETKYVNNKYPLAKLLRLCQNSESEEQDKVKKRITQYVKNTRTIGGSFLWPVPLEGNRDFCYNRLRGRWLEDRVDLTLLEIKHALEGRYDNGECASDMLYNQYRNEKTHIKTWLEHFGTFPEYVEYFMLEPFIAENGMPINIIDGKPLNEDYIKEYREQYKRQHLKNLEEAEEICAMLRPLEIMILKRSKRMEDVIKPYYEENHG